MTGVEILSSTQVVTEIAYDYNFAFLVWIVSAIFGIIIGIIINMRNETEGFIFVGLVCGIMVGSLAYLIDDVCVHVVVVALIMSSLFGALFGALVGKIGEVPIVHETQYKVTISDEVSMNDFYEHYEVIDQEGKIFTVRERDINE